MKVFVTRILPDIAIEMLAAAGITTEVWTYKRNLTPAELIEKCRHCDALLSAGANTIDKTFLQACPHLKVISMYSVGYNRVDTDEATRLKIPVGNTPDVLSAATADVAFLLMLASARKAFYNYQKILNGKWNFYDPLEDIGVELFGKTLGIWGLGKIGLEMARRCTGAYKMPVIYCNRHCNMVAEKELGAIRVTFDELLHQSDVLSVHMVLNNESKGRFNKEAFAKMKPSAIFINTARGAIHNEKDLLEALQNKTIWGAGLDVTDPEPMSPENPLLHMPSVAVLPHIGSATLEARNGMAVLAANNIIAAFENRPLPHCVNPDVYNN